MHEVFINYRTGDGEMTAALIDQALCDRFGEDSVFRASRSIGLGKTFEDELLRTVRRSRLLLAVVGSRWIGHPVLGKDNDWVGREIVEAFEWGVPVVPVIEGRRTERLNRADLPTELARLADLQSLRLDTQNAPADLARIGDLAVDMVPSLKAVDRTARRSSEHGPAAAPGSVTNSIGDVHGTAVQAQEITGGVNIGGVSTGNGGTVIKDSSGPVHTGRGDIYHNSRHVSGGRHISGDGAVYFEGDNQGGIHQNFGNPRRREDDDR
ncbi:hypothetical protein GCM10010406_08080 [Streptomyces thermolineatus]|uniref:TIR domain-containing protein n=1 Tax=Streptomyces thermolineatus TaxID=44033 RepID=A0ABN3KZ58_9ACTN